MHSDKHKLYYTVKTLRACTLHPFAVVHESNLPQYDGGGCFLELANSQSSAATLVQSIIRLSCTSYAGLRSSSSETCALLGVHAISDLPRSKPAGRRASSSYEHPDPAPTPALFDSPDRGMHALFVALNLYLGWKCARAVEMVFWVFRSFCVVHARTSTNVQGRHTLLSPSTFTSGVRTPWRQPSPTRVQPGLGRGLRRDHVPEHALHEALRTAVPPTPSTRI